MEEGKKLLENIDVDSAFRTIEKTLKGIHIRNGRAEGWAEKESHDIINKKWEDRYFIIYPQNRRIVYYDVPPSGPMIKKGEYELSTRSHCKRATKSGRSYCLQVEGKHNYNMMSTLYIAVTSNEIADEWVKILTKVIKGEKLDQLTDEAEACCSLCTIA